MKKLASFALAFALCTACAVPAFAEGTTSGTANPTSGKTTITTSIKPTYTVVIPSTTNITFDHADTDLNGTLHLSAAQLDPNYKVTISATANELVNQADDTKTIQFTLREGGNSFTSTAFTDTTKKVQLSAHIDQKAWNAAPAGNYEGSVTFKIAYEQIK